MGYWRKGFELDLYKYASKIVPAFDSWLVDNLTYYCYCYKHCRITSTSLEEMGTEVTSLLLIVTILSVKYYYFWVLSFIFKKKTETFNRISLY